MKPLQNINDRPGTSALPRYFWLGVIALALLGAWVISVIFPVYFRTDDIFYLQWAANHGWRDCLNPDSARLFGMFRPMQNLCWKFLYHNFGLNPQPYQFTLCALYFISVALYFGILHAMHRRSVAIAGFIFYLIVFYYLQYIVFWFSDFTYVIELFFLHAAILFLWNALSGRHGFIPLFAGAFAGALMSKEPAAVIAPCVMATMLWHRWGQLSGLQRRGFTLLTVATFAASAFWLVFAGSLVSRVANGATASDTPSPSFLLDRWKFYGAALSDGGGLITVLFLSAALAWYVCKGRACRIGLLTLLAVTGLCLRQLPGLWLVSILGALAVLAFFNSKILIGATWFVVPLFGVMTISYVVRTYLVEAAFGAGLFMTTILGSFATPRLWKGEIKLPAPRLIAATIVTGLLLAILAGVIVMRSDKMAALQTISANRVATGRAVEWLTQNGTNQHVVLVSYEDRGLIYERDILPLRDLEKARVQKSLGKPAELQGLLDLHGGASVAVTSLDEFLRDESVNTARIIVMNKKEDDFLAQKPVCREMAYKSENSRAFVVIYTIFKDVR